MAVVPIDEFFLDAKVVRRAFDAASATYDNAAAVHGEIRARLIERLDVVKLAPAVIVDLGAGTGQGSRVLRDRFSSAQVIAIDLSMRMLQRAAKQQRLFRRFDRVAADAQKLPLKNGVADMVFSNLMLQWCADPDGVFAETRRVLGPGGLLTFTCLGPDSLRELRSIWSELDAHTHVHRFLDMHDVGDALIRAGFSEPVMDTQRLTVTYKSLDSLLRELRESGSSSAAEGRRRGLIGRNAWRRFCQEYEQRRRDDLLPLTLEVVYGHAWAIERKPRGSQGETRVPVADIGIRGVRER